MHFVKKRAAHHLHVLRNNFWWENHIAEPLFTNHFYTILDITSDGQVCVDDCAFRGYSYSWCNVKDSWGYCTPASFLNFLHRLHSKGQVQPPTMLSNVSFDNLDRDQLLVEDRDANVIDSPVSTTTISTTTINTTTTSGKLSTI